MKYWSNVLEGEKLNKQEEVKRNKSIKRQTGQRVDCQIQKKKATDGKNTQRIFMTKKVNQLKTN